MLKKKKANEREEQRQGMCSEVRGGWWRSLEVELSDYSCGFYEGLPDIHL